MIYDDGGCSMFLFFSICSKPAADGQGGGQAVNSLGSAGLQDPGGWAGALGESAGSEPSH